MVHPISRNRIQIARANRGGGMVWFPEDRMDEVCAVFDAHGVPYWRDAISVSSDGGPFIASVTLSVKADVDLAQRLLDTLA